MRGRDPGKQFGLNPQYKKLLSVSVGSDMRDLVKTVVLVAV